MYGQALPQPLAYRYQKTVRIKSVAPCSSLASLVPAGRDLFPSNSLQKIESPIGVTRFLPLEMMSMRFLFRSKAGRQVDNF